MARKSAGNTSSARRKADSPGVRPSSIRCVSSFERIARDQGYSLVAGVDEVGRGCLFGPVFAAAVILDPDKPIRGLHDSKLLDAKTRARLAVQIKARCISWAVAGADVFEIDQINIYQASRLAMKRAVQKLARQPDFLLIDALKLDLPLQQRGLIKGDARCRAIAAASILAKVHRDACLDSWHEIFPEYNLQTNKGYATPDHRRALKRFGPTSMHRFSFEPVRASAAYTRWTGYITDPTQPGLFDQDTGAVLPEAMNSGADSAGAASG